MKISCSWCKTLNDSALITCYACGHDAQVPRVNCGCSQCRPQTPQEQEPVLERIGQTGTLGG